MFPRSPAGATVVGYDSLIMSALPFEWLVAVRDESVKILTAGVFGTPDRVEIGDMKSVPGTLKCDSALYIDGGSWYETGDRWPDKIQTTMLPAAIKCHPKMAFPITVRYYHCVPTMQDGGSAPTDAQRFGSAENMWTAAWQLWEGIGCALKPWRREYRANIIRTGYTPFGRNGGLSGFQVDLIAELPNCDTCVYE